MTGSLKKDGEQVSIGAKVAHVKSQGQTRDHHCHWPGCDKQVPPAVWGCKEHWYKLPKAIRDNIWRFYRPGQETDRRPGGGYIWAAKDAQAWIKANHPNGPQRDLFNGEGSIEHVVTGSEVPTDPKRQMNLF